MDLLDKKVEKKDEKRDAKRYKALVNLKLNDKSILKKGELLPVDSNQVNELLEKKYVILCD